MENKSAEKTRKRRAEKALRELQFQKQVESLLLSSDEGSECERSSPSHHSHCPDGSGPSSVHPDRDKGSANMTMYDGDCSDYLSEAEEVESFLLGDHPKKTDSLLFKEPNSTGKGDLSEPNHFSNIQDLTNNDIPQEATSNEISQNRPAVVAFTPHDTVNTFDSPESAGENLYEEPHNSALLLITRDEKRKKRGNPLETSSTHSGSDSDERREPPNKVPRTEETSPRRLPLVTAKAVPDNLSNPLVFTADGLVVREMITTDDESSDSLPESSYSDDGEFVENEIEGPTSPATEEPTSASGAFPTDWSSANNSYESEAGDVHQPTLSEQLAEWAVSHSVTQAAVDDLLEILIRHGHSELPKTAKTLLKTPRSTTSLIKELCGGEFWYGGILNGLKSRLTFGDLQKMQGQTITIEVFVDGISPYKSVRKHLCALAGCIVGQKRPFEIALWSGNIHEPDNVHEFFHDFVEEAETMANEGFVIDGISGTFSFVIQKFIGDALARAWMLQIVIPPNAYFCCERCTVKGRRTCFRTIFDPDEEVTLRTDESLANQTHANHHIGTSPLDRLKVKLLSMFPIEPMHNLYLGHERRNLQFLLSTKKRVSKISLKKDVVEELSAHLVSLKPFYVSELNRKLRSLTEWVTYKASELHRFALYDSFYLLRQLSEKKISKVHNLFACANRILSDEDLLDEFRSDADLMLRTYVKESSKLYGELFNVFNVHCLVHLADETTRHGDLVKYSAWKFETYLGQLKKSLRAPGRTLQQIVCRLMEKRAILSKRRGATIEDNPVSLSQPHNRGPTLGMCVDEHYQRMSVRDLGLFRIVSPNDTCFVSSSGKICVLRNILRTKGEIKLVCQTFLEIDPLFVYPFSSKRLGICIVRKLGPLKMLMISEMKAKVVLLPLKRSDIPKAPLTCKWMNEIECVCLPMLHHPHVQSEMTD